MIDVFNVAELLVDNAVGKYGQDIDIIACYGSYARDEARDDSDLDVFYIPANGESPPVGRTFLIDEILIDFWPIKWRTMEAFATGDVRGWTFAPALVHHSKILYSRSDEQTHHLNGLKQKILD